ncbi:hypothetical protein ACFQZZ_13940 [Nocardia sp. GCM10030253]|uniref:hypothetical protein n=1 Tax=Nocardia sp. GCM10030253 TaxID=3273404 RepID=UPI00364104D9
MTTVRQVRAWLSARRRFQFVLTVAMVMMLTGTCVVLLMVPNPVLPKLRAAQQARADSLGQVAAADNDPRLAQVRRTIEPFGQLVTRVVPTGAGQESLVVGHPAQRIEIDILARELGDATTAVTELWGPDWAQSALVIVASAPAEFAALLRSTTDLPSDVAAASIADAFTPGTQPTAQRVVFSPDAGRRLSPDGLRTLLRHELTHVATRAKTVDGAPPWMLEGFAEYAAHRGQGHHFGDVAPTVTTQARAADLPTDLPTAAAFTGTTAVLAYEQAWTVCAFIADKYDETRLVDLYRRIAASKQDTASEDRILQEVLQTTRADFVADWRAWLTPQAA